MTWRDFREVWCVDFEFGGSDGLPAVRCLAAREVRSGRLLRYWADDLQKMRRAPFECGPDSLVLAHYATAELGCFLALGWPWPENLVDTFVELRRRFNGLLDSETNDCGLAGYSLLHLAVWAGVPCLDALDKTRLRELAIRGGLYSQDERQVLLDYCQGDVDTLARCVPALLDGVDLRLPLALDQHYLRAVAAMERRGVPLDADLLRRMQAALPAIKRLLPGCIDPHRLVFRPDGSFSSAGFVRYCAGHGIPLLALPSGRVDLEDDTLRTLAKSYPSEIGPIRECRYILSELKLEKLAVGPDGRNHCLLSVYRSKTGRNQPSNAKFIFGPARWARSFIRPQRGHAVAYLDWQACQRSVKRDHLGSK